MANLMGSIESDRSKVHRVSSRIIIATLETWDGCVEVSLDKDGGFVVYTGRKGHPNYDNIIAEGNVNKVPSMSKDKRI